MLPLEIARAPPRLVRMLQAFSEAAAAPKAALKLPWQEVARVPPQLVRRLQVFFRSGGGAKSCLEAAVVFREAAGFFPHACSVSSRLLRDGFAHDVR